jgi:hypothetical protein
MAFTRTRWPDPPGRGGSHHGGCLSANSRCTRSRHSRYSDGLIRGCRPKTGRNYARMRRTENHTGVSWPSDDAPNGPPFAWLWHSPQPWARLREAAWPPLQRPLTPGSIRQAQPKKPVGGTMPATRPPQSPRTVRLQVPPEGPPVTGPAQTRICPRLRRRLRPATTYAWEAYKRKPKREFAFLRAKRDGERSTRNPPCTPPPSSRTPRLIAVPLTTRHALHFSTKSAQR